VKHRRKKLLDKLEELEAEDAQAAGGHTKKVKKVKHKVKKVKVAIAEKSPHNVRYYTHSRCIFKRAATSLGATPFCFVPSLSW
jgi:ElaB/YqjD/DUF883 family membrane-anchored ribosome-binding protein